MARLGIDTLTLRWQPIIMELKDTISIITNAGKIIVVDEEEWEVVAKKEVLQGTYEIKGLSSSKKLIVSRTTDGESRAYGNVTPLLDDN